MRDYKMCTYSDDGLFETEIKKRVNEKISGNTIKFCAPVRCWSDITI